jgi:two-component system, NarL family, nitrate/nitrite response regulator NarL
MTGTPVRIVIAAVNQLYRKTLTGIIQTKPNLQVVAEEEDGFAAIQAVEKHRPDVVLMGVSMPVLNGIDATWVIKSKFPDVRVIVLSMQDVDSISEAACKAGACWCLKKDCSPNELIKAIMAAENE